MDTYNYERNDDDANKLSTLLDSLSQKEAEAAIQAIENAKANNLAKEQENYGKWFDGAILPILKDFAEISSSVLKIEKSSDSCIISTITNRYGLDITDTCKMMKYVFSFASHIGIDIRDKEIILTLIFDYNTF